MRRLRSRRAFAICLLVVSWSAAIACGRRSSPPEETAAAPLSVTVEIARPQTFRATVTGAGVVVPAPAGDWTISSPETGRVAELPKAEGEAVKPGDVLVRFEYGNTAADVSAREAEIASTTRQLEAAEAQLARISALHERGFAARNDLDSAKNAVAAAQLDVARARQQLQAANAAAERAIVKARFAGIVAKIFHKEGELVNGTPSDPVLRVVDPTQVQVAMTVAVQDLTQIQPGQQTTFISANGLEPGSVLSRPLPEDPKATTQEIRVGFTNATTLPLDSTVQVEILIAEHTGVITLPASAVLKGGDGTPSVMVAGADGLAHRREIRTGLTAGARVEIVSGVSAGERVIVKDAAQVPEGAGVLADR